VKVIAGSLKGFAHRCGSIRFKYATF